LRSVSTVEVVWSISRRRRSELVEPRLWLPACSVYLPLDSSAASGDQAVMPSPQASAIGNRSRSAVRSTRLYCTDKGHQGRPAATGCERVSLRHDPGRDIRHSDCLMTPGESGMALCPG